MLLFVEKAKTKNKKLTAKNEKERETNLIISRSFVFLTVKKINPKLSDVCFGSDKRCVSLPFEHRAKPAYNSLPTRRRIEIELRKQANFGKHENAEHCLSY